MKYFSTKAAVLASLLAGVNAAGIAKGCYSEVEPALEDFGVLQFASHGSCLELCKDEEKMPVMALWGGTNCFCGDMLPPEEDKTDDDKCDTKCQGYPKEICMFSKPNDGLLTECDR